MAQSVARILGKDEVTGSNPVSSSKEKASEPPITVVFGSFFGFYYQGCNLSVVCNPYVIVKLSHCF